MGTRASTQDWSAIGPVGLLGRMARWLDAAYGGDSSWRFDLVKDTVGAGRQGVRVYHAFDRHRGIGIGLKAHASRRRNLAEFRALRHLHAVTPDSVRPLYLSAGCRFYAMEWVDAPSVATWLDGPLRQDVLGHAGAWLSRLHGATQGKPVLRRCYPRLPLEFRRDVVAEVTAAARLSARKRGLPHHTPPMTLLHDDFHPLNLAFDGARIIAMDRKRDVYGVPYFDIAKFLTALEITQAEAIADAAPAPDTATDRQSFLAGYGTVPERDAPMLDWFEDILIFRAWRHRRHRGDARLDPVMRRRGLLDGDA